MVSTFNRKAVCVVMERLLVYVNPFGSNTFFLTIMTPLQPYDMALTSMAVTLSDDEATSRPS